MSDQQIAFYLTTPKLIDPSDIDNTIMGGCEVSAINLARSLCKHGMRLPLIFANVAERAEVNDISHFSRYEDLTACSPKIDILICVRANPLVINPRSQLNATWSRPKKIILWSGDSYDQPNNEGMHDTWTLKNIDRVVLKSQWQRDTWFRSFPLLSQRKVKVIEKGVNVDWLHDSPSRIRKPKFIYASTAYRGLHRFLTLWPKIKNALSEATLDCYCKTNLYLDNNPKEKDFEGLYRNIERLDGVTIKDPVSQKEFLSNVLPQYSLMLYPNCGWEETSCGVVLESMAAGVPVITSAIAGLVETVKAGAGVLVEGDPESVEYEDKFVDQIVLLSVDNDKHTKISQIGWSNIRVKRKWDLISQKWIYLFKGLLPEKNV